MSSQGGAFPRGDKLHARDSLATEMVDLQETPAVPPEDPGGDVRAGWFIAGGLLIVLGWGLGVVTNLVLHHMAGSSGIWIGHVLITSTLGWYAWAVLGFGAVTGAIGVLVVLLARGQPKAKLVLPGYPY